MLEKWMINNWKAFIKTGFLIKTKIQTLLIVTSSYLSAIRQ